MDYRNEVIAAVRKVGTSISNLGSPEYGPGDQLVTKSESIIGHCVPSDYLAFLKEFGSGNFFGDELFGFYKNPSDDIPSGDLVYQSKSHRSGNLIAANQIPFLCTDFGEVFAFDVEISFPERMPFSTVSRITGDESGLYSESFIRFIYKYSETNRR